MRRGRIDTARSSFSRITRRSCFGEPISRRRAEPCEARASLSRIARLRGIVGPRKAFPTGLLIASLRRSKNARTSCRHPQSSTLSYSRTCIVAPVITRTSAGLSPRVRGTRSGYELMGMGLEMLYRSSSAYLKDFEMLKWVLSMLGRFSS